MGVRLVDRLSSPIDALRDSESTRLLAAGVLTGLLGGLAAVLFDHAMTLVGYLVLGSADPGRNPPSTAHTLLGPAAVGVVVGILVQRLTRRRRPQNVADVLARVQLDEPTLSLRDGLVSATTAALAVGGGFSGGREGPIVQFASALAGWTCKRMGVRPASIRTLVAAGAAAGIAASFNTPLGGAFFALEIILGNFAVQTFVPVVAATVTGTVVGQAFLGDRIALHLPAFEFRSVLELPLYLLLGAVGAVVAHAFKHAVMLGSARISKLAGPPWFRPVILGLGVGAIAAAGVPQVMGNGYGFMEDLLRGAPVSAGFLVLLLAAKVAATSLTVAARTGAGLFAASLFTGAITGAVFGIAATGLWPEHTEAVGAYGMVGMGSVTAAVLSAPITMTLMLFEMTGNYHVILPLMMALAASGLVSMALGSRSLYEMELEREGLSLAKRREGGVMHDILVGDILRSDGFEVVRPGTPLPAILDRFLRRRVEEVYVADEDGTYRGSIHIQDVKPALANPGGAAEVRPRLVGTARREETLAAILPRFFDAPGDALPVVDASGHLVGVVAERDVVAAYHREGLLQDARLAHVVSHDEAGEHNDYLELPAGQVMEGIAVGPRRSGKSLRELGLPKQTGCTVVAMSVWDEATGDWQRQPVDVDRVLRAEDKLILIGPADAVRRLDAIDG